MITKIIVTVFGVILIIFVNWFFLFSRRKGSLSSVKKEKGGMVPHEFRKETSISEEER